MSTPPTIPVVDVSALVARSAGAATVAAQLDRACRGQGFFHVVGHGVDAALTSELERGSREFFAQETDSKLAIRMERGGRAWRGYFPVGGELTLGRPDHKEGLYFGAELGPEHPRVRAGVPLHGANLFPDVPGLRECVLATMDALEALGRVLMEGLATGLGLAPDWFRDNGMATPTTLFRIFHYPPLPAGDEASWSVAEHTDYGVLTILLQDDAGGLQVRTPAGWIDAPPVPGAFLCNIGDMLDRMTGGLYRSTPHRVRNTSGRGRLSFPFFFDPDFEADVRPIDLGHAPVDDRNERWDGASVHEWSGTYGEYLLAKVSCVFPQLGDEVL